MPDFEVRFRGPLGDAEKEALEAAGVRWLSGPGDEPWHPSAPIYESVEVEAGSEQEAIDRVRDALDGRGSYTDFHAAPEKHD